MIEIVHCSVFPLLKHIEICPKIFNKEGIVNDVVFK